MPALDVPTSHKRWPAAGLTVRGFASFTTRFAQYEKLQRLGSRGSMIARLELKGIDGRPPQVVERAA